MQGADWQDELRALVDRAAVTAGPGRVADTLRAESERLSEDTRARRLVVEVPVLGAVRAETCWVAVLITSERPPAVLAGETLGAVVELARGSADPAVAAIGAPWAPTDLVADVPKAAEVVVVDPVANFSKLAGGPLRTDRDEAGAARERRALLAGAGLTPPAWFRGSGFTEADLLDACAAAWTAVRRVHDDAEPRADGSGTTWV